MAKLYIEVPALVFEQLQQVRLELREQNIHQEEHDERFMSLLAPHCRRFPQPGETMEIRIATPVRVGGTIDGKTTTGSGPVPEAR